MKANIYSLRLTTIALTMSIVSLNASAVQGICEPDSDKQKKVVADLSEPQELDYDLEIDEHGNFIENGTETLIQEGMRFLRSRKTKDPEVMEYDLEVDNNGNFIENGMERLIEEGLRFLHQKMPWYNFIKASN